jgi:hypothetical protein
MKGFTILMQSYFGARTIDYDARGGYYRVSGGTFDGVTLDAEDIADARESKSAFMKLLRDKLVEKEAMKPRRSHAVDEPLDLRVRHRLFS